MVYLIPYIFLVTMYNFAIHGLTVGINPYQKSPLDANPVLNRLEAIVIKQEFPLKFKNIYVELLVVFPLGILVRWILYPLVLSEFQVSMKEAIHQEKVAYNNQDVQTPLIKWKYSDFYELFFDVFDTIKYDNAYKKIMEIRKIIPETNSSERFKKEIARNRDGNACQDMVQSLGICVSNFIDDIKKLKEVNKILVTYYHLDKKFNHRDKEYSYKKLRNTKIWQENIYLIMEYYKTTISNLNQANIHELVNYNIIEECILNEKSSKQYKFFTKLSQDTIEVNKKLLLLQS